MIPRCRIAALGSLAMGLLVVGCAPAASDGKPGPDAAAPATGGNPGTGGSTGPMGTGGVFSGSGGSPGSGGLGSGGTGPTGSGGTTGTGGSGPSASGGTSTGGAASGGQAGNSLPLGTGGSGQTGGRTGSGGSAGGNSGTGGGAGGQAGNSPSPFTCSQIIGLTLTSEWYLAGFERGVDPTRWQLKFAQSAYVNEWANANSNFWNTQVMSPCARNATAPDRVVLVVLSWTIMAQTAWETAVGGAVSTIKLKYPAVSRIELMTIVRGPQNASCGNPNVYAENTHIPVALDNALAKIAAAQPQLVRVAPKFEVSACSDYMGVGPHLTAAGNAKMAAIISAHYAKEP